MTDPVRIAHVSDTHLGYRAYGLVDPDTGRNQRTIDVERAFSRAIDGILAAQPDLVLHSGDVFHQSRPSWHAIRHFVREMRRLEVAHIPTLVIAGNHDTPRLRTDGSVYSVLDLALPAIRFVADYDLVSITDLLADRGLRIQALPHGALTNDDPPMTTVRQGKRNVLVSHGVVPGVMPESAHGEPGEKYLNANVLDPAFTYIALGHYHVHTHATARSWYAGSTERFGFGDRDATPGWTLVELGEEGSQPVVTHHPIDVRPMLSIDAVYGNGRAGREIADAILGDLAALDSPTAMASISLRDVERPVRREVESIVRREASQHVWLAHFIADRSVVLTDVASPEALETTDVRALFAQFVEEKRGNPWTATFADRFRQRGDAALESAIAQAEPEGDGGAA